MKDQKSLLWQQRFYKETVMKEWLTNYVGKAVNPADENVTVEMIVEVMAKEFPEFLLVVAEENFIRGYEQALTDVKEIQNKYAEPETSKLH